MTPSCPLIKNLGARHDLTRLFFKTLMGSALLAFAFFVAIAFIPGMFCCQYDEQLEDIARDTVLQKVPRNLLDVQAEPGIIEWVSGTAWVQVTAAGKFENGTPFLAHFLVGIDRKNGRVLGVREVSP